MSDPTFAPTERRSLGLPILLAVALLAIAATLAIHFYPATSVQVRHIHTDILPTHTVFRSDSIVLRPAQSSDTLFVASTIRIDDTSRTPITLDNVSCTFTDPSGAVLTAKAATRQDLANEEISFPALKSLVAAPLLRDIIINPSQSAQGNLLFSFPFTKDQWSARKSATIQVDIYHGQSLTVEIPKP